MTARRKARAKLRKRGSKSSAKARPRRTRSSESLPDLSNVVDAFHDAQALVLVAHMAVADNTHYGPEENVLRQGVEALDRVSDQFDEADMQLGRLRRKHEKTV
jgi:hypothetical protein